MTDPNHKQNYIHWSQYGSTYTRNDTVNGASRSLHQTQNSTDSRSIADTINTWTINFSLDSKTARQLTATSVATFTIQLAAAKTTAGNTDVGVGEFGTFPVGRADNNIISAFLTNIACTLRSTHM